MAYGLNAGSGGFWDTNSTYDQPVYEETVTRDIATQGQDVQAVGSNDSWTDFFKKTVSTVFDYSLKKDAVITGAEVQKTLQAPAAVQPIYYPVGNTSTTSSAPRQLVPGISNTLLLLGVAGYFLVTAK
jgi:hypothetical protein